MGELYVPNADPISNTVTVTEEALTLDLSAKEYCIFLFDNQGSEPVYINLLPSNKVIKLVAGCFISFEQDEVSSVTLNSDEGKTTSVMYLIQGNA